MKIKNVNVFERHFEKLVLALGVVFAIAVIWFFGRSVTVEYKNQAVAPEQIEKLIYKEAQRLEDKVNSKDDPFPEVMMPPYARRFAGKFNQPLLGPNVTDFEHALGTLGLDRNDFDPASQSRPTYTLPQPPAATDIVAFNEIGVLAERDDIVDHYRAGFVGEGGDAMAKNYGQNIADELGDIVSEQAPRDFHYVKIGGKYSMKDWQEAIENVPVNPIPEEWWLPRLLFVDVILERQTLLDNGQWGSVEQIALLPGSHPFRNRPTEYDRDTSADLIDAIYEQWVSIARPEFVPLAGDQMWRPPTARQLTAEEKRQLHRILTDIERIDKTIERMEISLAKLDEKASGVRKKPEKKKRSTPSAPSGGDVPFTVVTEGIGGGIGDYNDPGTSSSKRMNTTADRRDDIRDNIADLMVQRKELEYERDILTGVIQPVVEKKDDDDSSGRRSRRDRDYINYGDDDMMGGGEIPMDVLSGGAIPMDVLSGGQRQSARRRSRARKQLEENIGDEVNLWAHDITVQAGKTYRYRMVVELLNPLFYRKGLLTGEQEKEFLHKPAWASLPSEWSQPIEIRRDDYFFTVSAVAAQQSAKVEVWRIYDGNWRVQEFTVRPGEPVGEMTRIDTEYEVNAEVDMSTDVLMVDVVKQPGGRVTDMDVLFLDLVDNELLVRSATGDSDDDLRQDLLQEKAIRDADIQILGPDDVQ